MGKKAEVSCVDEGVVVKSNDLINASYRLSLNEQRLILLAIAQVRRDQSADVTQNQLFRVTAEQFAEVAGIHPKTAYRELTAVVKQLYERSLKVPGEEDYCRWIQRRVERQKGSGYVDIRFSYDVAKHLSDLSERFTKYNIKNAIELNSVYAIRLYETMVSLRGYKNQVYLSIENIRSMYFLEDKYKLTSDLKRYVIEDPINEINKKSKDVQASFEVEKQGRKIIGFTISFDFNEKSDKNKEKKKQDNPDKKAKPDAPSGPSKRALEMMEESKRLSSEAEREDPEEPVDVLNEIQKLLEEAERLRRKIS